MCKEAANEHCNAIALGNENKALMEELASVKDDLSEHERICDSLRSFKAEKIVEHDEMAEFLIEQAEKWSATDIRAKAIEMLGASGYPERGSGNHLPHAPELRKALRWAVREQKVHHQAGNSCSCEYE